jgi:hypothetical protein
MAEGRSRDEGKAVWIYEEGDVLRIFDTDDEARLGSKRTTRKASPSSISGDR